MHEKLNCSALSICIDSISKFLPVVIDGVEITQGMPASLKFDFKGERLYEN